MPVNLIGFMCATGSSVQCELPCVCEGLLLFSDKDRFAQNGAWDHPPLLGNPSWVGSAQGGARRLCDSDLVGNILSGHWWVALEVTAIAMPNANKAQIWLIS